MVREHTVQFAIANPDSEAAALLARARIALDNERPRMAARLARKGLAQLESERPALLSPAEQLTRRAMRAALREELEQLETSATLAAAGAALSLSAA